jgi:6-phosphogluconolactonase (cycloisomerase 2 family)
VPTGRSGESDNGSDELTVSANGTVAFAKAIGSGGAYSVVVVTLPTGQTCAVNSGIGTMPDHDIIIGVSCVATSTVSAVVTGITNVSGLVLQDNGADNLAVSTSGTYPFATRLTEGQSYDVRVLNQPAGHTCSVLNGSGTIGAASVSVTVVCPWHVGYRGYAGSGGGSWIAADYIDQSTGATTPGNLYPAGNGPWALEASPTRGFLYADDESDNTVSGYVIDPSNGNLTAVPGSPFMVGAARSSPASFLRSITIDPQGHYVYVLDWQGDIVAFSIDLSTGALTPLSTTALGISGAFALTVSSRNVLYVIGSPSGNPAEADIAAYSVNSATGALTPVAGSPFTFSSPSGSMDAVTGYGWDIDPAARFFYVSFTQEGAVPRPVGAYTVASIDPTSGALTAVAGSPFALTHAVDSIAIDNTGKYFYGGNSYENVIQEFDIDQNTGVLSGFATESVPGTLDLTAPYLTGFDPSDTYLFCSQDPYSPYSIYPPGTPPPGTPGMLEKFLNGTTAAITNAVPVAFSTAP